MNNALPFIRAQDRGAAFTTTLTLVLPVPEMSAPPLWSVIRLEHQERQYPRSSRRMVRHIGLHCVTSNDPYLYGIYVLLLFSIDLFLRKMEFSSLEPNNFSTTMFVMTAQYTIEALNVKVKGKRVSCHCLHNHHPLSFLRQSSVLPQSVLFHHHRPRRRHHHSP